MPTKKTDPLLLVKRITDLESQLQAAQAERGGLLDAVERLNATIDRQAGALKAAGLEGADLILERAEDAERQRDALREALKRVRAINSHRMNRASVQSWEIAEAALRASTPSEDG